MSKKVYSTQCECGVWTPIVKDSVVGTKVLCPECKCKALHPAGKLLSK